MKQITTPLPSGADYLPVVLVRQNLGSFARARDIALEESADDLDVYTMAHLISDSGCQCLLVHYAGADRNTFDIWLPTDVSDYGKCLSDIVAELRVPSRDLVERKLGDDVFGRRTA